jgi:hypothetical protein
MKVAYMRKKSEAAYKKKNGWEKGQKLDSKSSES